MAAVSLTINPITQVPPVPVVVQDSVSIRAAEIAKLLQEEPRIPNRRDAQSNPHVLLARKFLKKYPKDDPRVASCAKELLAMKLSIQSEVFDANPGFEKFATASHLERYLMEYPTHPLTVHEQSKKISLLVKDKGLTEWTPELATFPDLPDIVECKKKLWRYGLDGLQNEDLYHWSELKPFKKVENHDWGNRYIFEFCSYCTTSPKLTNDHAWLRLKTPEGEIYSVGLYRPEDKKGGYATSAMNIKRGHLMSPDVSEYWPQDDGYEIKTIPVEITKDDFFKMKAQIESDQKEDKQVFQLFQANCVLYTKKIARIAGIEVATSKTAFKVLTVKPLESFFEGCQRVLPSFITKICSAVFAFFMNLLLLILGASKVDPDVIAKNGPDVPAHINTFWDVFDVSKTELHHPNALGHMTRTHILQWQEEQIKLLEAQRTDLNAADITKQIEDMRYKAPALFPT